MSEPIKRFGKSPADQLSAHIAAAEPGFISAELTKDKRGLILHQDGNSIRLPETEDIRRAGNLLLETARRIEIGEFT